MANSKMVPKTLGIPIDMLEEAERVAAIWQKERTRYEKKATWADVVRHGLGLAFAEESSRPASGSNRARGGGQQLTIGGFPLSKKKVTPKAELWADHERKLAIRREKAAAKRKAAKKKPTKKKRPPPRPKRKPAKKATASKGKRK